MVLSLRLRPVGTKLKKEWSLIAIDHRRTRNSGLFIEELARLKRYSQTVAGSGAKPYEIRECFIDRFKIRKYLAAPCIISKAAHKFLALAGYLPPYKGKLPPGWNKELWKKEFKKAEKYFLAKHKLENE